MEKVEKTRSLGSRDVCLTDLQAVHRRLDEATAEAREHGRKEIRPKQSMYGIFTYIWLDFMVNVRKPYAQEGGHEQ